MVASGNYPGYALFEAAGLPAKSGNGIVADPVATVALYAIFHRDMDVFTEGEAAVRRHGGETRDYMASINAAVIWMPLAEVRAFAMEDAVQWLEPPLPPLEAVNDSSRARIGADTVNASPYNLDGSGVNVLVYDAGAARGTHVDFGGRLTVRDASGMAEHSTHVAGTIGGDGTASGGTYRGMAPGVTIQSYGFEYDGSDTFLYTNPETWRPITLRPSKSMAWRFRTTPSAPTLPGTISVRVRGRLRGNGDPDRRDRPGRAGDADASGVGKRQRAGRGVWGPVRDHGAAGRGEEPHLGGGAQLGRRLHDGFLELGSHG